jgi:hypothetical protein
VLGIAAAFVSLCYHESVKRRAGATLVAIALVTLAAGAPAGAGGAGSFLAHTSSDKKACAITIAMYEDGDTPGTATPTEQEDLFSWAVDAKNPVIRAASRLMLSDHKKGNQAGEAKQIQKIASTCQEMGLGPPNTMDLLACRYVHVFVFEREAGQAVTAGDAAPFLRAARKAGNVELRSEGAKLGSTHPFNVAKYLPSMKATCTYLGIHFD